MTAILVVGLSHHTAPVEIRERAAVDGEPLRALLKALPETAHIHEAVVLSTCNRVEVYAISDSPAATVKHIREHFSSQPDGHLLSPVLYEHHEDDAVKHAFRVASSLDSMVVGEPQILGQLKGAVDVAKDEGALGTLLGRCFSNAFGVAKRVRTQTEIAEGTVSVSSIACALAKKIFGEMKGRRVLLLGAGEMGEAAARALSQTGARLHVVNRSPEKAERLAAQCEGTAAGYEQLASELVAADIVITSTSSKRPVLTDDLMKTVVRARRRRPLFLIDIAVPRDVDPRVGDMENIFLYDVDDLQQVARENMRKRQHAAEAAERIVSQEVQNFQAWRRSLNVTPTIVALREHVLSVLQNELNRTASKTDLSPAQQQALERMCSAAAAKLLHHPIRALKAEANGEVTTSGLVDATRTLFELTDDQGHADEEASPQRAGLVVESE